MSSNKLGRLGGLAALALGLAMGPKAEAAYIITLQQVGNNLVATGSGSINLSGLTSAFSSSDSGYEGAYEGNIFLSGTTASPDQYYTGITGPSNFGTGGVISASSGSGNVVGVMANFNGGMIGVPTGYISGSSLGTSTATWNNESLSSLSLKTGSYVWSWGSGANADSLTLNITDAAVPEPASLALLAVGAGGVLVQRRKRKAARRTER